MNIGFSKINFGATPLFDIKLKKRINDVYQPVDARVSELNPHDDGDQKIMDELCQKWNVEANPFSIMGIIQYNFQKLKESTGTPEACKYYVTEIANKDEKTTVPNITSVIEMSNPEFFSDMILINSLQTNPQIVDEYIPSIKGAGELAIYAAVRLAKMFASRSVQLDSCANGFYKEIGMKEINDDVFSLGNEDYDSFLKRVENKYSFSSK